MNVKQLWNRHTDLKNEIKELEISAKECMDKILELQKTCDHEAMVISGFPFDSMVCKKCNASMGCL